MIRLSVALSVCSILIGLTVNDVSGQRPRRSRVPQYYQAFASKVDTDRTSEVTLRNGLVALVEEQPILPLAAVVTYVKVDADGASSAQALLILRVFFERLGDFRKRVRRLGGTLEVIAKGDHFVISSTVPSDEVEDTLEIHSEMLRSPPISDEQLREGLRLLTEQGESGLASDDLVRRQLWEMAYPGRGERHARYLFEGEAVFDNDWTVDRVRRFHRSHFQPSETVISVSGAVFRETVLRSVVEFYSTLKTPADITPAKSDPVVAKKGFAYKHLRGNHATERIGFAYRVASTRDNFYPAQILAALLGKGRGSYLPRYGASSSSIADVSTQLNWVPHGGTLEITLTPSPKKIDAAEVETLALAQMIAKSGPATADLDRAKAILVKEFFQSLEGVGGRAYLRARHRAWSVPGELAKVPERIAAVSATQVRSLAAKVLIPSNLCLLEYIPEGAEPRQFEAAALLETLDLLVPARLEVMIQDRDAMKSEPRKSSFKPSDFKPKFIHYDLRRTSVLRGPDIFLEENHVTPLVYLAFLLPGGRLNEDLENSGITEVALEAMLQAVESVSGNLVWHDIERLGGNVEIINEPDFFGIQVSVLSPHLETALGLFHEWWKSGQVTEEELERIKQSVIARALRERDQPGEWASLTVNRRLFGAHPYSYSRYGNRASVDNLTPESVQAWLKQQVEGFHPLIIIRGDVEGTAFLPELIPELSNSKLTKKERPNRPLTDISLPLFAWSAELGRLVFGFQGPVLGSRDAWVLDVLERFVFLLQGPEMVPTERRPLLPKPNLYHESLQMAGAVYLTSKVPLGKVGEYYDKLVEALAGFESTAVRRQDFVSSIVGTVTQYYIREQEGEPSMANLARNLIRGEKPGFRVEYLSTIKGVQLEEMRSLGSRVFKAPERKPEAGETE